MIILFYTKLQGMSMRQMIPDTKHALRCGCPQCGQASIYPHRWTLQTKDTCPHCGFPLSKNDSGDGPAVFLIFILGFLLMPMALVLEVWLHPPLWAHAVIWGVVALGICVLSMQPLKAYVMILQYRHLPESYDPKDPHQD